jgi:hypothetical protein
MNKEQLYSQQGRGKSSTAKKAEETGMAAVQVAFIENVL